MEISKQGLLDENPIDWINLSFQLNPEKLQDAFSKIGLRLETNEDLVSLSEIIKNKYDIEGKLKINDNPAIFDSMNIIKSIEWTESEKEKAKTLNYIS
jgi:hypothetical protein